MNLYEILEVSENASKDIIEKVYKIKVKKYHPDLQKPEDRPYAEEKMKEINDAYDVLSDDYKRREYDNMLSEQRRQEEERKRKEYNNQYNNQYVYQRETYTNNVDNNSTEYMQKRLEESMTRLKIVVVILIFCFGVKLVSGLIEKNIVKQQEEQQEQQQQIMIQEEKEYEEIEKKIRNTMKLY